ncbi:MBL fold metallo-hydrolase [Paenarthrobacter sp. NPDC089316]|uniref:MBL fold metallo-hydrolase n=1 Tax=unclassified Paenarthrobacter TaxID=2634190 RepID=UPI003431E34B
MATLSYEVLVLDGTPRAGDQRLPSGEAIVSSPLAITLISGERDAVLVDAPYTFGQIERVRNWIRSSGKTLRYVYITHAHGDHWLGVGELLADFPGVRVYATPGTLGRMEHEATVGREKLWDALFPGLVPPSPLIAESVPAKGFEIEGNTLIPIELGHTDTDDTTALWVPSMELVVAGDCVYNGVHQYLLESSEEGFTSWHAALDTLAALEPKVVIAGHKAPGAPDDPKSIEETRAYLRDAQHLLATVSGPAEYYEAILRRYPFHVNPGPAWYGALGLLSATP